MLVCATDAGGARNILALLPELARHGADVTVVTRGAFLPGAGSGGHRLVRAEDISGSVAATFAAAAPCAVICGTTRHHSPDREFLGLARQANVRSVALVDEWFNYAYRFAANGRTADAMPDAIALPDRQAVSEAVDEGLPSERCFATGSPALAATWEQGRRWAEAPPPTPVELEGAGGRPVITFLSETHAHDYGDAPGTSGAMGPYLGYTETTVREQLLDILGRLAGEYVCAEKPHPSATSTTIPDRVPANVDYRLATRAQTAELCVHSSVVIGMRSMALLEARLLGCRVVSFQPGLRGAERCSAVRLGLVTGLRSSGDLQVWLDGALARAAPAHPFDRPAFARSDAAERVVQLALGTSYEN